MYSQRLAFGRGIAVFLVIISVCAPVLSPQAMAQRHGGHVRFGVYVGVPAYYPFYTAPRYYAPRYYTPSYYAPSYYTPSYSAPSYYYPSTYSQTVIVPSQTVYSGSSSLASPVTTMSPPLPPSYNQTAQTQSAMQSGATDGWWYFCPASKAFYPYVNECAIPWQRYSPHQAPPN